MLHFIDILEFKIAAYKKKFQQETNSQSNIKLQMPLHEYVFISFQTEFDSKLKIEKTSLLIKICID